MKRLLTCTATLAALTALYTLRLAASVPTVPSNTWAPAGDMASVRAGASGTLLPDGRVLVAGGVDEHGVVATVERFSPEGGSFLATPPMPVPRANHTATLLKDGRVLVAGGTGSAGPAIAAAEIYDPSSNVWLPVGSLHVARRGHTATLLADGRLVVAGGDDAGVATDTIEIFDPATEQFSIAGTLSAARTQHAAARLVDGRVFIAGGNDGTNALGSTDMLDPATYTVFAGPTLNTARSGLTATTLLDGKVLVAGGADAGGELASGEVFDPATGAFTETDNTLSAARQNHLAFLLPHNNQVLIVGGLAGAHPVATAEFFTPWQGGSGTFCSSAICADGYAGPAVPATARAWATGSALSFSASATNRAGPGDGLLVVAGGTNHQSTELFGFATIKTDRDDYAPGETVTITGSGWQPGEWVALVLRESPILHEQPLLNVQADENGHILSTEFAPDEHDLWVTFTLTAYGGASQAATRFTDGPTLNWVTLTMGTTIVPPGTLTVQPNATISAAMNVTTGNGSPNRWTGSSWRLATSVGAMACVDTTDISTNGTTTTLTFPITAPPTSGTYNGYFLAYASDSCDPARASQVATLASAIIVDGIAPSVTVNQAAGQSDPTNTAPINFTVTFSEAVAGFTPADVSVSGTAGGTKTVAVTGSGPAYNVAISGVTTGGTVVATIPAGTVTDAAGNSNTASASTDNTVTWDTTPPTVSSINRVTSTPTNAATVQWTVTFSKSVTGVGSSDFALAASGLTSTGITGVTGSGSIYTVAANTGEGSGTLGLALVDDDTVQDAAGNRLGGPGSGNGNFTGQAYTVDRTLTPTITASSKIYDGSHSATIASRGFTSALTVSEDVAVSGGTASFADRNVGTAKTVTATGLSLTGAAALKYVLSATTAATTGDITARTIAGAFTANSKPYDGTTAASIATRTLGAGVVGGDVVSLSGGTATFDSKSAGTGKTVTGTGFSLSGLEASNYQLSSTSLTTTADISALALTVSGVTADHKTYDGMVTASLSAGSASLQGAIGSDAVSLNLADATGTFADKNVGTGKTVTVSGLTLTGVEAPNYTLTQPTLIADITPKGLILTGITAISKTYDRTTTAVLGTTGAALVGLVSGDTVTPDATGASGAFADWNVAVAKTVTISGVALSGSGAGNYSLTQPTALADIVALAVTGSVTASHKEYDGGTSATIAGRSLAEVISGDTVNYAGGTAAFSDKNAGSGKMVTATGLILDGPDAGNYTVNSTAQTTADITPRALTVVATGVGREYDGTATATVTLSDDRLGGDLVVDHYTSASFLDKSVGAGKTVNVSGISIDGTDAGNYTLTNTTASTTASITPKALTVTATGVDKVYDGTTASTVILTDDRIGGDTLLLGYTSATFTDPNVGAGKPVSVAGISATGADAGNYNANTSATTAAAITSRPVTITADSKSKTYGDADPPLTFQVTAGSLVSGDSFSGGLTRVDGEHVGAYAIEQGTVAISTNYTIGYAGASLMIRKKAATVAAHDKSKIYGDATPALDATVIGAVGADVLVFTLATTADASSGVGAYPITVTPGLNPNYEVTATDGTLTVGTRTLTVTATGTSKLYDGTVDATVTLSDDRVPGDALTLSYANASFGDKNVGGAKPVAVSGIGVTGVAASNYTVNPTAFTTASITALAITGTIAANDKIYDGTPTATIFTHTLSGGLSGDDVSYTGDTATFADKNVGTGKLVTATGLGLSGADAGNYTVNATATATASVSRKGASVTPFASSKIYGSPDSALNGGLVGFVAADGMTATYSRTAGETVLGGPYTVSALLSPAGELGNYDVAYNTAHFTITAAAASVAPDAKTKVYGDPDPTLSGVLSGFLSTDNVTASYSRTAGEAVAGSPYTIGAVLNAGPGVLSNYSITNSTNTFGITKATLTVTADDQSRPFGMASPTFTASYSGFKFGETRVTGGVTNGPTLTTAATATSPVGDYPIVAAVGSLAAANYQFAFVNGTLHVTHWTEAGFFSPVDMTTGPIVWNTVKGGSTVPLKFRIYAGTVEQTTVSAVSGFQVLVIRCEAGYEDPINTQELTTTGGTSLRYEGQFIQNWQTPKAAGVCYRVVMTAADGSKLDTAFFKTK